jgi:hypothetical protein
MLEKILPPFRRQDRQNLALQLHSDGASGFVFLLAPGLEVNAMRPTIVFMGPPFDEARFFHAPDQGGDGIRITAHDVGQLSLGQPAGVPFEQDAQRRKLIRSEAEWG